MPNKCSIEPGSNLFYNVYHVIICVTIHHQTECKHFNHRCNNLHRFGLVICWKTPGSLVLWQPTGRVWASRHVSDIYFTPSPFCYRRYLPGTAVIVNIFLLSLIIDHKRIINPSHNQPVRVRCVRIRSLMMSKWRIILGVVNNTLLSSTLLLHNNKTTSWFLVTCDWTGLSEAKADSAT